MKILLTEKTILNKFWQYLVLLLVAFTLSLPAQSGTSLAHGDAWSALARGPDAIFWNPANLALHDRREAPLSFSLCGWRLAVGNNSLNRSMYEDYFTNPNRVLSPGDIDNLLSSIPEQGIKLNAGNRLTLFSVAFNNFGISLSSHTWLHSSIPKEMLEVPLRGLEPQTNRFYLQGEAESTAELSLAYGHTLYRQRTLLIFNRPALDFTEITVGASLSFLFGLGSFYTRQAEMITSISDAGISAHGEYFGVGAFMKNGRIPGRGAGLNLGISGRTPDHYIISIVFRNVFHHITWNQNAKSYKGSLDTGLPKFILGDDQLAELDGNEIANNAECDLASFSSGHPFDIRLGVGRKLKKYDYAVETGTEDHKLLLALGGGVHYNILHLFSAYRYYSAHFFNVGIGLGGQSIYFDISLGMQDGLTARYYKGLVIASSLQFGWNY